MQSYLVDFGTFDWYCKTYSMDVNGTSTKANAGSKSVDLDEDVEDTVPSEPVASSYTCLKPLTLLCAALLHS